MTIGGGAIGETAIGEEAGPPPPPPPQPDHFGPRRFVLGRWPHPNHLIPGNTIRREGVAEDEPQPDHFGQRRFVLGQWPPQEFLQPGNVIRREGVSEDVFDPSNIQKRFVKGQYPHPQQLIPGSIKRRYFKSQYQELSLSTSNIINFFAYGRPNIILLEVSNHITFQVDVQRQLELSRSQSNHITFAVSGKKTILGVTATVITFAAQGNKGGITENLVLFDITTSGIASKKTENIINFSQTVSALKELGVSTANAITFAVQTIGWVERACDLYEYTPLGILPAVTFGVQSTITFVCGVNTLELRNPEFGNADSVDVKRTLN
ncbi:hypothetical protein LCGC14_1292480, partial [marine sediment metagenome]